VNGSNAPCGAAFCLLDKIPPVWNKGCTARFMSRGSNGLPGSRRRLLGLVDGAGCFGDSDLQGGDNVFDESPFWSKIWNGGVLILSSGTHSSKLALRNECGTRGVPPEHKLTVYARPMGEPHRPVSEKSASLFFRGSIWKRQDR